MTDEELSKSLSLALTVSESDRKRLTADFAQSRADEDARLWQVIFRVVRHSQGQLHATLNLSRAATRAAHTLIAKG